MFITFDAYSAPFYMIIGAANKKKKEKCSDQLAAPRLFIWLEKAETERWRICLKIKECRSPQWENTNQRLLPPQFSLVSKFQNKLSNSNILANIKLFDKQYLKS
jgi:hypothetical protein